MFKSMLFSVFLGASLTCLAGQAGADGAYRLAQSDYMREFYEAQREFLRGYNREAWQQHEEANRAMQRENYRAWLEYKRAQDELLRGADRARDEYLGRFGIPLLPGQLEAQRRMRRQMIDQQDGSGWQYYGR